MDIYSRNNQFILYDFKFIYNMIKSSYYITLIPSYTIIGPMAKIRKPTNVPSFAIKNNIRYECTI